MIASSMPADSLGDALVGFLRQEKRISELQDRVAKLFEETREDVYRYLLTLGLHPPSAQEAVQEVFLRLYTALKKGEDIQNPRGWVFRVAHNYGLKQRGRQASEAPFDPEMELRLASRTRRSGARFDRARKDGALSPRGGRLIGAAEALPVFAHGGVAVSGDRRGFGHQRIGGGRVFAAGHVAAKEGGR